MAAGCLHQLLGNRTARLPLLGIPEGTHLGPWGGHRVEVLRQMGMLLMASNGLQSQASIPEAEEDGARHAPAVHPLILHWPMRLAAQRALGRMLLLFTSTLKKE